MKYLSIMLLVLLCVACSNQEIYNTVQHNNELECSKLPQSQFEKCMAEVDQSYENYEREVQELKAD